MRGDNSFDLLRLMAAFGVLWSHQFPLLRLPEPGAAPFAFTIGGLSVAAFFAISGYLNTLSLFNGRSVPAFLIRRLLRIYPALIVCVVFCLLLGAVLSTLPLKEYWASGVTARFALHNITLVGYISAYLPGVFPGNVFAGMMNGSLWTLPYEIWLYVFLGAAVAICGFRLALIPALFAVFMVVVALLERRNAGFYVLHGGAFAAFFFAGSFLAHAAITNTLERALAICFAVAIAGAVLRLRFLSVCPLTAVAIVIMGRAQLPRWLRPRYDISYGVYLYAWPIQQLSAHLLLPLPLAMVFSLITVSLMAFASCLLVEKPALRLKDRLKGWLAIHRRDYRAYQRWP